MFKCCVCHGKASRRTSQEDDEDDSSRDEEDESSSSSSSGSSSTDSDEEDNAKDDDPEEKEIEEDLAKKIKCQTEESQVATVVGEIVKEPLKKDDKEEEDKKDDDDDAEEKEEKNKTVAVEEVIVEVNGDVRGLRDEIKEKTVDREAIKEDVVEILNSAVKIVQERLRREGLEKIKEEAGEEAVEEASTPAVDAPATNDVAPAKSAAAAAADEEIDTGDKKKTELEKVDSDDTEEDVITVIEEDEEEGEYVVNDEVKKEDVSELEKSRTHQIEEMIIEELINELNEEADNSQELKDIVEPPAESEEQPVQEDNEQAAAEVAAAAATESPPKESSGSPVEPSPTPPPPPPPPEIIEEIKKTDAQKAESPGTGEEPLVEEVRVERGVCPSEGEVVEETLLPDILEGDLLNIPPPVTPPPEEAAELDRLLDESNAELSFPTPPPIDFDVADAGPGEETEAEEEDEEEEQRPRSSSRGSNRGGSRPPRFNGPQRIAGPPVPPWEDDEEEAPLPPPPLNRVEDFLPVLHRRQEASSPGSKSLPSPPSPDSDGNETELSKSSSKSSSDEAPTPRIVPCLGSKKAYIERTIVDNGPDDEGDDSVFEPAVAAKPPEIIKDIPPRPVPPVPRWLSQEEDEPESNGSEGFGGMQEPPATPVARDELALRRHRFFSDLLQAAKSTAEHRVSFDPLGPTVHTGCEHDDREEHLEELVSRLENVTKRLEQVSAQAAAVVASPRPQAVVVASVSAAVAAAPLVQTQEIAVQTKSPSPERSLSITEELPHEETSQSSSSSRESTVSAPSVVEVLRSMSVAGFEDILAGPVQDYIKLSNKIGGDVAEHCKLVDKAFQIQLHFLKTAASRPAPTSQSEQVSLLGPTSTQIQSIQDYREKHRGSPFFNHLSAISESIPALGWVAVAPTPAPYVKEMNDAGQFYTNRVLKDWKEKDKTHVEWCKAWVKTLTDLQQFVRQNHTTGLVWAKAGTVPPPPAGGIPPPPPPCLMPLADPAPAINDDRSALFAEINQGENITKNLKKVTSDMQTHKNASLRTGPAPFKAPVVSNSSPVKATLPANVPIDKPPVFTRDGKKWLVEYHKGNKDLLIDNVEMNNVIYMFRCQESNLIVKGKVNSVVMDSCRKSSVVFDTVVASVEFVNCQSVQMQALGKVPTISIDKTDGCQMYLNKDTLDVELITSKSSEMNVMVPVGNGDYTEYPVPEQFKTKITKKGLSTTAVDALG